MKDLRDLNDLPVAQIEQLKLTVEYSKGGANLENEAECAGREGMERPTIGLCFGPYGVEG